MSADGRRPPSPTVGRRELAVRLRRLRIEAGMTLEAAAAALEVSAATLSRIETGVRVPRARDVRDLAHAYGVKDEERIERLTALVTEARETGWWEAYTEVDDDYATYIGLEAAASAIEEFAALFVPGLLQVPDYARAHFRQVLNPARRTALTDHDIEKRIEVRARRRELLDRGGLRYSVILDEAALRRPVGDLEVMRGQLEYMIEVAGHPTVDLRLMPFDHGAHAGQAGAFIILNLPQDEVADVVYVESPAGQLFIETPAEVERYRRSFSAIRDLSLDAAESRAVMQRMLDQNRNTP